MKILLRILKFSFLFLLALLVLGLAFTFLPGKGYLRKAAWQGGAGIKDHQIFENRTVKMGKGTALPKAADYNKYALSEDEDEIFTRYRTTAFLILQNGKIKFENYWEDYDANTRSNSFSVAKTVVALLIGCAIDEGKIKHVNQKVSDFLPSFKEGINAQLSIKDLLTMSAALDWEEAYINPLSTVAQAYFTDDLSGLMEEVKVKDTPGKVNDYQSGATQILGAILAKATGKTLSEYASEKLWIPVEADSEALWSIDDKEGVEKAYCCFNTNAQNFARLGQLVLQKGKWKDKQVVSEEYINQLLTPASYLVGKTTGKPVDYYGYQIWMLEHQGEQVPHFRGVKGQYVYILEKQNAVVVRLGHQRNEERIGVTPKDAFEYLDIAKAILKSKP